MIIKYIISLCLMVIPFSISAAELEIPGAKVYLLMPNGWKSIDKKGFSKIVHKLKDREEFKKTISLLEQVNKYAFIKKFNSRGELINSNLMIVTMKLDGESLNLEEILESHIRDKKAVPGVIKITKGICPKLKHNNYQCLTQYSKRGNRSTRQYHYITINNKMYVQFSFNAANTEEIKEVEGIISNMSFSEK